MTIDEAIEHAREVATIQRNNDKLNKTLGVNSPYYKTDCLKCAEEHEQLAEWLEEYKWLNKQKEMFDPFNFALVCARKGSYEKAVNDFVEKLMEQQIIGCMLPDGFRTDVVTTHTIDAIAEQLKAGGENER